MGPDIPSIKPVNLFTIRRVRAKRDHQGQEHHSHQDADQFAEELGEEYHRDPDEEGTEEDAYHVLRRLAGQRPVLRGDPKLTILRRRRPTDDADAEPDDEKHIDFEA